MLWLGLYFRDLPIEVYARAQQSAQPLIISERRAGCERVYRCSPPAMAAGVRPDMPLAAALALQTNLLVLPRDQQREQQGLAGLALWAYQFSSHIQLELRCLLLEIGASLRLFGGLDRLLDHIERTLPRLGYHARLACAPTPAGAALLARARPGSKATDLTELRELITPIPLIQFTREPVARELVQGVGLHTIGDCLALPRAELSRRVGPQLGLSFDRLLGSAPDPRPTWQPPAVFADRLELLGEITIVTALVFPARRLILALCGFLRGHGGGTQTLSWRLEHRELPTSRFTLGLLAPSRDPDHILELLRERIDRLQLTGPVTAIGLRVADWQPFAERSGDLFDTGRIVDRDLLERLRSRLGDKAVQGIRWLPDHRPERAWALRAPGEGGASAEVPVATSAPAATDHRRMTDTTVAARPLWLLQQPRPLRVMGDVPSYGGPLKLEWPAERIEAGWWDGDDVARDYHIALSPAGERLWVYRDRRSGEWFLQGLFD